MRVKTYERLGGEVRMYPAAIVIVETDAGDPISISCEFGPPGAYCVTTVKDEEEFLRIMRALGIDRQLIIDSLTAPAPPAGAELIRGPGLL